VRIGLALLVAVLAFGAVGYTLVGLDPFDALYQTAITVTTVGYGEVGPPGEIDRTYRAFTLLVVLLGATSAVYTASVLLETLVEGSLNDRFRRRRMLHQVDRMRGHVIVAGWGRVGHAIARYARRAGADVVVVDLAQVEAHGDPPMIIGDATDDDTLLAAGIERAATLIAALSSDNDNLSLTLTARSLRSDLFIVARAADQRNERKFLRAGADRVVNPYQIGGSRMGAIAIQPHVAEFLDDVLDDEVHDVDIQEVVVGAESPAADAPPTPTWAPSPAARRVRSSLPCATPPAATRSTPARTPCYDPVTCSSRSGLGPRSSASPPRPSTAPRCRSEAGRPPGDEPPSMPPIWHGALVARARPTVDGMCVGGLRMAMRAAWSAR
jgi:voltage-gated potassium channel